MFPSIGGTEYLILAVVALLVFKPQDLPVIMKRIGAFMGQARRMAADFRASFEDMARQSELDVLRKEVEAMKAKAVSMTTDPISSITDSLTSTADQISQGIHDPTGESIYDPAAWMGEDLNPAPDPAAAEPETIAAPKPKRKPRAKKAPVS
jgi:sec-independent protein translocase protein TatB